MKKTLLTIIALLCVAFVAPMSAHALTVDVSANCAKTSITSGETTTCTIDVTPSNGSVSAVDLKYAVSSNLTITNATKGTVLSEGAVDEGHVQVYGDTNASSKFTAATLTIKANEGAQTETSEMLTLSDIIITDENDTELTIEKVELGMAIVDDSSSSSSGSSSSQGDSSSASSSQSSSGSSSSATTVNKVSNPKTADMNIIILVLAVVIMSGLGLVGYKKLKKVS